jgi:glycosyltransferase involved in cell wall biosynthesis
LYASFISVPPCYNAAATVDEAVASVLQQTQTDFELVAVDDGSTDETGALLQAWAATGASSC